MDSILSTYSPISLSEMTDIKLMNRTDTKFVTDRDTLQSILCDAHDEYLVQEIDGKRIANYYTVYFDTPSCDMFEAHQSGRLTRQKLRIRSYVDSGLNFLEVKSKNNHGRTRKQRVSIDEFNPLCPDHSIRFDQENQAYQHYEEFIADHLRYSPEAMCEQIENRFRRITLVNKAKTERLTIDLDLSFHNIATDESLALPRIVIIELKRDGLVPSPILEILRRHRVRPMGFSKYCVGQALTNRQLRQNRLKKRLHQIDRIIQHVRAI